FTNTGEYTVTAEISKENYHSVSVSATIKIVKAMPNVAVKPFEGNLVFGDPLPTIECNNPDGEVSLDANQELIPGAYDYSWTFVPSDAVNYEQVKGTLQLTVNKASTSIQFEGEVRQSVSNPQKFNAEVQAKTGIPQGDITYSYFDSRGNEYSALPTKGGKYTIVVSYSGNEYYAASTYSTVITVDEPTSYKWVFVLLGALATLGILGGIIGAARKRR
ncbi:MAG: hypothetical protein PHI19_07015, partial [Clostridia bacterium]|nr:hypothetical protein [Clostridia bacterium]